MYTMTVWICYWLWPWLGCRTVQWQCNVKPSKCQRSHHCSRLSWIIYFTRLPTGRFRNTRGDDTIWIFFQKMKFEKVHFLGKWWLHFLRKSFWEIISLGERPWLSTAAAEHVSKLLFCNNIENWKADVCVCATLWEIALVSFWYPWSDQSRSIENSLRRKSRVTCTGKRAGCQQMSKYLL